MKNAKLILVILTVIGVMLFSNGSKAQQNPGNALSAKNILIVYITRTKNTEAVAQIIQQQVGGKLVGLELVKPYPENYREHVAQIVRENEQNYLPPLKTKIENIEKYDVIFVGFPTWDMKIPPPMKTFLHQYNLAGKTVVPFNTNAGYGVGSGFDSVRVLCPKSKVLTGYSTTGGIERDGILFVMKGDKEIRTRQDVLSWLQKIRLSK